jgi:general secretion pathway protein G
MKRGFSLIEMLIVVAILGILAAIVLPEFQSHSQEAREAAAKDNLRILRQQIEVYAAQHDGIPPGYPNDDPSQTPIYNNFGLQMVTNDNYLSELPKNPFNDSSIIEMVGNSEAFPTEPLLTNLYGWIYQPATKTIKLNWTGTDSHGIPYFSY